MVNGKWLNAFVLKKRAPVAQWIEQETSKLKAVGSNPTRGTISICIMTSVIEVLLTS